MRFLTPLLLCATLQASEPVGWSRQDTVLEAVFLGTLTLDYLQTRDLIKQQASGRKIYEQNPLLGPTPTQGSATTYFALMALGHVGVALLLPSGGPRTTWQGLGIALEVGVIANNYRLGLRVRW